MALAIDRAFALKTLSELVQINSVNPALEAGGPGEAEAAGYVADTLRRIGLDVELYEPQPGRPSVAGVLRGKAGGRRLMLNGHVDTVGVAEMREPFSGAVRDGKLYGRGSYDMKGSVAACIAAAKALADAGAPFRGEVLVAAVADEENASIGTADLVRRRPVDAAIVTEPTHLDICLAHKGFVWIEVETIGRAAHGSRPDLGVDANMAMGRVLERLSDLEANLRRRSPHPLVGTPSLHAAQIAGGTAPSVYAAHCRLTIERRTVPGETESGVLSEIQRILEEVAAFDPGFRASCHATLSRDPFEVSPDRAIVRALATAASRVLGRSPQYGGQTPWMDSALLAAAGVETVVFGPSGAGAHAVEEWVDVESVMQTAEILAHAALAYLGSTE
ncbi:MAG TPA: ArgE/DapE family deacylase [Gemmatimonadales bacterium]|nr:ArgE/DapE family deacylase [Gemmatimonadales bacterium]